MSRIANMVQIDKARLIKALDERKLTMKRVSQDIGFNDYYLKNCAERGTMRGNVTQLIQARFGIPFSDYEYVEPEPKAENEPAEAIVTEAAVELDPDALKEAITGALDGMKPDYETLRAVIREGVLDALYQAVNDNNMRNALFSLLSDSVRSGMRRNIEDMRSKGAVREARS